jgi:hypothetical protein
MARFWGDPVDGETCDACDEPITKQPLVMEGIASTIGDTSSQFSFASGASVSGY